MLYTAFRASDTSFNPDNTFQQAHRTTRSQPSISGPSQTHFSRPLSSADETGPVPKKLRPAVRQVEALKSKPSKLITDDPLKKARARPALSFANLISSGPSQPTTSSRAIAAGKSNNGSTSGNAGTRRSNRLKVSIHPCTPTVNPAYSPIFLADSRTTATASAWQVSLDRI